MKIDLLKFLTSIAACHLAGVIGAFFTSKSIPTWYASLKKPFFNPPNFIFAPVWLTLYTLMGVSLYIIWDKHAAHPAQKTALALFGIQLLLNALWSPVFFGLRAPLPGFIVITLLLAAILATMKVFHGISTPAFTLLVPYFLWVAFASVLNFALWRLN